VTKSRLTKVQIQWLLDLCRGNDPWEKIHGQSAHGGAHCTAYSLMRRELLDKDGKITDLGRKAVQESCSAAG
jgi:hypothetical protein